ncbi:MAG: hypothetical protein EHM48_00685 [Planctomycetaceae bacterium]|nr:MAG: hypothetical protein EHM48_00685 [Planctomycetaceae bacterium]
MIGMLWFDNDPKSDLVAKISRAGAYYQRKYGQTANMCFVHPSMLSGGALKAGSVEVKTSKSVLPNHFWLGVDKG